MTVGLLANALHGVVVAAKPVAPDVLPTPAELDIQLTGAPAEWAKMLTRVLDAYVDPLFSGIPATSVPGAPGSAAVAWNNEAQIRKLLADPASVTFNLPATNHLPLSKVDNLSYKLRSFLPGTNMEDALNIYLAYIAAGRTLSPTLTATKAAAKRAIRALVVLEAFLVRISAAINAAATVGVSLAETLALYRVEGDLVTPISNAHLQDRLPFNEKLDVRNLGIDTGSVSLTLQRGLWSYPYKALAPRALGIPATVLPAAGSMRTAAEKKVKCFALIHWMLVIGGVDVVARTVGTIEPIGFRVGLTKFVDKYRTAVGLPSVIADREVEFDSVFNDLTCSWPADEHGRVVVAPNTPVLLASFALTIALLVFRRDHAHGGGPFIQPPLGLEYLGYHVQADLVAKENDRFVRLLASAAVAAAKSMNPMFGALKARLAPLGLPTSPPKDPAPETDPPVYDTTVFDVLTTSSFLNNAASAGFLADFILRAEGVDWRNPGGAPSYADNRGNLARYRKLLEFYKALLA